MSELISSHVDWNTMKSLILKGRVNGIPTKQLPSGFYTSIDMLQIFEELNPTQPPLTRMVTRGKQVLGLEDVSPEAVRVIKTDSSGTSFLVQTRNTGVSRRTSNSVQVIRERVLGEIGDIHNHPIIPNMGVNSMPSSIDVLSIISGDYVIRIIVGPEAVTLMLRSDETIRIPHLEVAKGYLIEMGRKKRNRDSIDPRSQALFPNFIKELTDTEGWMMDLESLRELKIAVYQAARKKITFIRKA